MITVTEYRSMTQAKKEKSQGWRILGSRKFYFRSKWEYRYACHLEFLHRCELIKAWDHEPQTFWFENIKRGVRSYLPDFRVERVNNTHYWVEVKGYMDAKSKTKIRRLRKYYPDEELIVVDAEWFKRN